MNPNNHFSKGNLFFHFIRIRFLHSSIPPLPTTAATCSSLSYTVDFLVNSCGLSSKSALSISNKLQLDEKKKTPQKLQSFLQFLKSHHFSDAQVARLIVKRPEVLNCRIHDNLKPKFEYLVNIGFKGELLPRIILSNTEIIADSLASKIKPAVQFLRLFLDSDEKFLMAVKRGPWILGNHSTIRLQQNIDVLIKEAGLPAYVVQEYLTLHPRSIFQNRDKLISVVNSVKNLGFEPTDTMFIHAFRVRMQMSESTWNKKIEVMKSIGFSKEDTLKAFKRLPQCLGLSEQNIRKTLHFYFNTLKLERRTIIVHPNLLGLSIEKRVRPRYLVLKVLESKKLIKMTQQVRIFVIAEKNFREKYIDQFIDEVPGLLEFYLGMKEAKTSVLDGEERDFEMFGDYHSHCNSSSTDQTPKINESIFKSKSRALKIYNKVKQPISPGGKLVNFINSIFTSGNSKKSKNAVVDEERKFKSGQASTCSSASSFSRSCLSKSEKFRDGVKRNVRFYPVSVIVDEDCRPCGQKSLYRDEEESSSGFMSVSLPTAWKIGSKKSESEFKFQVMDHNNKSRRSVEQVARDLLREYQKKNDYQIMRTDHLLNLKRDDDDEEDDVSSCASSDLFELDHLSVIGKDRYCEELPVYETTRIETNRAIANGFRM